MNRQNQKDRDNIVLTGFMGSGKTSVGLRLSYRLQKCFVDTDHLIEQREGRTISEIFATDGEEVFRRMETKLLEELASRLHNQILSVGGGTPLREENRELLRQIGTVVYFRVRPKTVYERLMNDHTRPLLQGEDPLSRITELLGKRERLYEEAADVIVDVDQRSMEEIMEELLESCRRFRRERAERGETAGRAERAEKPERAEEAERVEMAEKTEGIGKIEKAQEGKRMKILVINGPNLNFLGIREKSVYGTQDYQYLLDMISAKAKAENVEIPVFQSNHEGAIIDRIQEAYFDGTDGIVINPGAFTHYSYAIRDALASITVPKAEIHISDITKREEFRKVSVTAPVCDRQIYGQGLDGYLQAIDFVRAEAEMREKA